MYLELFDSWFRRGGPLESIDGIAFDVQYWDLNPKSDTNADGVAEGGIIDGDPRWTRGVYEFNKAIREHFGDDFIITSDGHHSENQRTVGIINGIESEGLVQHNDAWRGISRTVNTHRYWQKFNTSKIQFSYVAAKLVNPQDAKHPIRLRRFAHAMAACLGVACTNGIDEITKGIENKHYWLGKPIGPMVNLAEASDKVLYGMPSKMKQDDLSMWSSENGSSISTNADGGIVIAKGNQSSVGLGKSLALAFELTLDLSPGDLFISFDAKSQGALPGFSGTDVPRAILFDITGHYADPRVGKAATDMFTLVGPRDFFHSEFYVRNSGGEKGAKGVKIRFEIEGQADLLVRNFVVRNATAAYAREFENGVVLVNPSLHSYSFDLEKQFGPHTYRRLQASHNSDSADPVLNNGALVKSPNVFHVGPVSAQFLVKE